MRSSGLRQGRPCRARMSSVSLFALRQRGLEAAGCDSAAPRRRRRCERRAELAGEARHLDRDRRGFRRLRSSMRALSASVTSSRPVSPAGNGMLSMVDSVTDRTAAAAARARRRRCLGIVRVVVPAHRNLRPCPCSPARINESATRQSRVLTHAAGVPASRRGRARKGGRTPTKNPRSCDSFGGGAPGPGAHPPSGVPRVSAVANRKSRT